MRNISSRKITLLARILSPFVLLLAAPFLVAQDGPAMNAQPNTIYVSAEGKNEAEPDTANLQFTINAQDNTSEATYARASKAAERMREVLRANHIDPKSAEIGYYSLQPVYDYKQAKRKIVGFRVTTNVSLKLKDFAKAGTLAEQLAAIEDTEEQSLSYSLEGIDAAKVRAIEDGFARARLEAGAVAKAGGRVLGELLYSAVDTQENRIFPQRQMMMGAAKSMASPMPPPTEEFAPAKITITAKVNAVFQMR